LTVVALSLLIAPLVSLTYPYMDNYSIMAFIISIIILWILTKLTKRIPRASPRSLIKALVFYWFLSPLMLAPLFSFIAHVRLIDAYFEMVSGLSGTGFTILNPSSETPFVNALRATTQWTGEVGTLFLTLLLALVYHISPTGIVSALGKGERVRPNMYQTLKDLVLIYIVLTIIPTMYMILVGMSVYDAIVYTFAALATGGFAPTNGGTADLSFPQQLAVLVTCVLGALNFSVYLHLRYGNLKKAITHPELKLLIASILFYTILLLLLHGEISPFSIWNAMFHSASAVTTSGFSIADVSQFSQAEKFVLIVAMLIGASTFSTGGGIKLFRIYVLWKVLKQEIKSIGQPLGYVKKVVVYGREVSTDDIAIMMTIVVIYMITFLGLSLMIIELVKRHSISMTPVDVMFEVSSAMSGTGLSSGLTALATADIKILLAIAMVVGKVEVIPVLLVLYSLPSDLKSIFKK